MTVETDLQAAVVALNNTNATFQSAIPVINAATTKAAEAAASATAAAGSATTANTKAVEAASSASAAAGSATSASGSATTATTKANEAIASATNAGVSATSAASSATSANAAAVSAGAPVLQTLVDGPAVSWDVSAGKYAALTMGGNRSIYFSKIKAGEEYRLFLYQDSTGGRTPKFSARIKWAGDVTPTWTTTANSLTIIRFSSNGTMLFGAVEQVYDGYIPDVATDFCDPNIYNDIPSWLDYSGITGNRMYYDSTGKLTWAPHNLLLNSATLATQTVAVTVGMTNILSFSGTGSVTLSGAATGTLAGTGANNRVFLPITMATTSLTLTVTGSVTQAQLERVTYQTTPRPWISTGNAAIYLPRFDYNPSTTPAIPIGLCIEESKSNLAKYTENLNDPAWAAASGNIVISANAIPAPDGTTTADKISGDGVSSGHFIRQTVVLLPNTTYTASIHGKADEINFGYIAVGGTGASGYSTFNYSTGTLGSLQSNLYSREITSCGNGWYRANITFTTGASVANNYIEISVSPTDSIGANTTTGGVYYWGCQVEVEELSSYIPNNSGATSVTRAADLIKLVGSALTAMSGSTGTIIVEYVRPSFKNRADIISAIGDGTNKIMIFNYNGVNESRFYVRDANNNTSDIQGASSLSTKTRIRAAAAWQANNVAVSVNGGNSISSSVAGQVLTNVAMLGTGSQSGMNYINGHIAALALNKQTLPILALKSKSIVEASF